MKDQMRSELRKLTSTRTARWLALGVVGMALLSVTSASGQSAAEYAKPLTEQQFFFLNTFSRLLLLVLGIRLVTDEFRYGTAIPTFVSAPERGKVLLSKTLVAAAAGSVIAALGMAVLIGSASALFSTNGHELVFGSRGPQGVLGGVLAGGLWAVIGVGVGAIVRNQVVAIVGSFVWLMALEEMVRTKMGDLGGFLPGQAGFATALVPDRYWGTAVATFVVYALVATVLGIVVTRVRDVA